MLQIKYECAGDVRIGDGPQEDIAGTQHKVLGKNSVNNIVRAPSLQAGLICGEGEEASISHRCH